MIIIQTKEELATAVELWHQEKLADLRNLYDATANPAYLDCVQRLSSLPFTQEYGINPDAVDEDKVAKALNVD